MLLAGGVVGVAAPILLQRRVAVNQDFIRVGSGLLLVTIIVGAVFDAIDEYRTTPVLLRAGVGLQRLGALALAEDSRLIAAAIGDTDPENEASSRGHETPHERGTKSFGRPDSDS